MGRKDKLGPPGEQVVKPISADTPQSPENSGKMPVSGAQPSPVDSGQKTVSGTQQLPVDSGQKTVSGTQQLPVGSGQKPVSGTQPSPLNSEQKPAPDTPQSPVNSGQRPVSGAEQSAVNSGQKHFDTAGVINVKRPQCLLHYFTLDQKQTLMNATMVRVLFQFFRLLDVHNLYALNDIQFYYMMHHLTDMSSRQIPLVFDMLDKDGNGRIEFDEFYLIVSILVAKKDGVMKKFIFNHARNVFDLLDKDGSMSISVSEFIECGFLFDVHPIAVKALFKQFDFSGNELLDYREFRLFALACIDKQQEIEQRSIAQKSRKSASIKAGLWSRILTFLHLRKPEDDVLKL